MRKIGEKIVFSRIAKFAAGPGATLVSYIHNTSGPQTDGGRIGVLVEIAGEGVEELGREVAQHISFAKPKFLSETEVDPTVLAKETALIDGPDEGRPEASAGKPEAAIQGAISGRVKKFLGEVVLLNQPYIRDDKKSVAQYVGETKGASIVRYACFQVGENVKKAEG